MKIPGLQQLNQILRWVPRLGRKPRPQPQPPPAIEAVRNPALTCPRCGFRILMTIELLLSGNPIHCQQCALKLTVDQAASETSLGELRKLDGAIKRAERAKRG